jgi:peptidoglycan hydrolase CwlO-like protein
MAETLRDVASDIESLEEDYDTLVKELEEDKNEIDRLTDTIKELQSYIDWAESFYPDMAGQYKAICDVRG